MKRERRQTTPDFNVKLHYIGRIWTFIGVLLIISVPVILGIYFNTAPDWTVFGSAAVIIPMILNLGAGLVEPVVYAPMLGTNGEYLAFITGNLSNLKIPCVVKAQEIVGTKVGTEENELVSTIAIATSTLVTAVVIGVMVLCLAFSNLNDIIQQNRFVIPAFGCVVYALFGSLGGKYLAKNPKLAMIPAAVIVILSGILGALDSNPGSVSLFIGIGICVVFVLFQYRRERNKQRKKEEMKRLEAIAAAISYEQLLEIDKAQAEDEKAAAEQEKKEKKNK